jgi:MoaA/NifB/PqqE/SkfB family radical SAM enzyme
MENILRSGRKIMEIKPACIRLEASTLCQLNCRSCPTAKGEVSKRIGAGYLKFENFRKVVIENSWICEIELSNWGEIFLNPDLLKIMKYACQKNVILRADNGVNLNTVNDGVLEGLVKYKLASMCCSIDGASQKSYEIYRRGGNFERVIDNIRKLNYYKSKYKSEFPALTWQFIAFAHNEDEIQTAKAMAKELKMNFFLKLSFGTLYTEEEFSPVRNMDLVRKESEEGAASRKEYREKSGKEYGGDRCKLLWLQPQINFDGRVLGCCVNYWDDYGNVYVDGVVGVLNNERMNYAREMLMGNVGCREDIPCTKCGFYKIRKENREWIRVEDVERDIRRESRFRNMVKRKLITIGAMNFVRRGKSLLRKFRI